MTADQFAHRLLAEARVAVVPGTAFTQYGEGYIRISYAYAFDQLEIAMDRLENWLTGATSSPTRPVPVTDTNCALQIVIQAGAN